MELRLDHDPTLREVYAGHLPPAGQVQAPGTFSPLLDGAGNSVRGQLATQFLPARLGLNIFASEPANEKQPRAGSTSGARTVSKQENNSL